MTSVDVPNPEAMSSFIEKDTDNSTDSASATDMQVKEEPEDPGYEQTSVTAALSDHSFTDSVNSSPVPTILSSPAQSDCSNLNQSINITNLMPQIPLNDLFAGSAIRSQLHGAIAGRKMDTVENIVESLLKKNETLLAMSDAGGFKPNARRVRAAHDGFVKRTEPAFPCTGQVSVFPVSHTLLGHVNASKKTSDTVKHHMIRPKSPTRRYDGMLKDKTHFTYALMESSAADHEIEKIFNVQNHELVCAIGSKSLITDKFNKVVASLEFGYFWCNFCPFSTNNKSLLTQHVLEHRFCCKYCAYESFCRSDVVRHMHKMHPDFKDTAGRLSYCTFLSDYLRVKATIDEKENKDPDEDVDSIYQEETDISLQDLAGRKRQSESDSDNCTLPVKKYRTIDEDNHADYEVPETSNISHFDHHHGCQVKSRKNHNPKRLAPPTEADYDIFDMEVEEVDDGLHNFITDESENKFLYSSNLSNAAVSDKQPVPTGMVRVVPYTKGSFLQTLTTTDVPNPARTFYTNCPRGSNNNSYRGNGTSSLYWSCGYCTFQSNGQAEIKDHSNRAHPGKPHRYVALIKNSVSEPVVGKNLKGNTSRYIVTTVTRNDSHSPEVPQSHVTATSVPQVASDSRTNSEDNLEETRDIITLKEKDDSPRLLKVKINSTKVVKKEVAIYKCYHCLYTSKRHWTMKSHIYHKHSSKALVAVDDESASRQRVFFCARDDCTFRSENANAYLCHVDQCTPWNKPELADVEVEPHIRQCLEQTIANAETAIIKKVEPTISRTRTGTGDTASKVADLTCNGNLWTERRSSYKNQVSWSQSQRLGLNDRAATPLTEMIKEIRDMNSENAGNNNSESVFKYCRAHNYIRNSKQTVVSGINEQKSNVCYSVLPKDNFILAVNDVSTCIPVVVDVSHTETAPEHGSVSGDILIEHVQPHSLNPLAIDESDEVEGKARACSVEISKESIFSVGMLSVEDSCICKPILTVESEKTYFTSEFESKLKVISKDCSKVHVLHCIDKDVTVNLAQNSGVKCKKIKSKVTFQKAADHSNVKMYVASADTDKLGSPSLKIKFKAFDHATGCSNNNSIEPGIPDADRKRRTEYAISDTSLDSSDEENVGIGVQNDLIKASKIQNLQWLKDLIDSTGDSDSDTGSDHPSVLPVSSVKEICENSPDCVSNERDSFTVCDSRDHIQTEFPEQKTSSAKDNSNQFIHSGGQLLSTKAETAKSVIIDDIKPDYSYVPLRSAAVKAISKMKPALSSEEMNKYEPSKISFSGRKSAMRHKMSHRKSYSLVNHKPRVRSKRKSLTDTKFRSEMSNSVYMCQYCIDISEGPLTKIKPHVLSKHSSMPPMVINCFQQRHHNNCQFYICPSDACYKLSTTQEESEAHKSTHEKPAGAQISNDMSQCNTGSYGKSHFPISVKNVQNAFGKVSKSQTIEHCRVELDLLDMSKIKPVSSALPMPEDKNYQCLYCTNYYYDMTLLGMKAHYMKEHEGQLIVMRDTEARKCHLPSRIYVCENSQCECFYMNRSDLEIHAKSHKPNLTFMYECVCCGWYSASHLAACHHVKNEHADEETASLVHTRLSVDEQGQTSKKVL